MLLRDDWKRFWEAMDRLNVWGWPRRCTSDKAVHDGSQWELRIIHGGLKARSEGSNAYPFTQELEPSSEFQEFVEAVSQLVGSPLLSE